MRGSGKLCFYEEVLKHIRNTKFTFEGLSSLTVQSVTGQNYPAPLIPKDILLLLFLIMVGLNV